MSYSESFTEVLRLRVRDRENGREQWFVSEWIEFDYEKETILARTPTS